MTALLVFHLIATPYMTGLIWLIQIVHYPLMWKVGDAAYFEKPWAPTAGHFQTISNCPNRPTGPRPETGVSH